MQLHEIKPKTKRASKKRIGRGGKRGTYSGRGMKGQKSRAGGKVAPVVREVLKRYPKLKGYRGVKRQRKPQTVTLQMIVKKFSKDELISPASLFEKELIFQKRGVPPVVKIVGIAILESPLSVQGCLLTAGAKKSIEESGGSIT
ncbi:MAG: uL15 family ribosomal protein [bacterium]|nr:uL15 family ribosomal protein [bacterium]